MHSIDSRLSISVGIPTYNRPDLLDRALASVAAQVEHPDEVIIGDNSDNCKSEEIYKRWKPHIPCLRYIRHSRNIGALGNFLRLAEISTSSHFMWLADDDALDPTHLCVVKDFLANHQKVQYIGWGYQVHNYVTGSTEHPSYLPSITMSKGNYENACSYLKQPISCYFYGLYDRKTFHKSPLSRWHKLKTSFDWMDVAFVMYNILNYKSHFLSDNLITYGIDEIERPRKGAEGQPVKDYTPTPWLMHGIMLILFSSKLTLFERLKILPKFIYAWKNTTSPAIKRN
jgi:glycosyltransferase involved in cell wall biosynthesis